MFGERLKECRKRKGWNQEELAKQSGYSRSSIINWETGKRAPRTVDIEKLAETLGVSQYDLFGENMNTQDEYEPIRLQTMTPAQNTAGYAYWGKVLDEAKRVAKLRDMEEIGIILPMLKVAYDTLISVQEAEHGDTKASMASVSAYNGSHSNYVENSLIVGATE